MGRHSEWHLHSRTRALNRPRFSFLPSFLVPPPFPSSATPDQSASKDLVCPFLPSRSRVARAPHTSSTARAAVRAYLLLSSTNRYLPR
ncbi:hypothetical protein LX32DRAFT_636765 [Colletotrichum zoysiae]|uniref:Uncharacterized protein n=1 Tax=Colletotrichum zoysiae TaxID=1216348 RepID=A0AAD9HN49_9PEZI|nr:hypothetical protein LX32DRAFT_636765 [Colletotrichum zoysiae]